MMFWRIFVYVSLFFLALAVGVDMIPITRIQEEKDPIIPEGNWIPVFADEMPGLDEVDPFELLIVSPAKGLPAGWDWWDYDDGSGSLHSPDGKHHFSYDFAPYYGEGGIEYRENASAAWRVFWGTPDEFRSFCEERISTEVIAR